MADQRVTKATAQLAQDKGFDEPTYQHCWVKTLDGEVIHNSERENKAEHHRATAVLAQPTQTQLCKWLREKHGLLVIPKPYTAEYFSFSVYRKEKILKVLHYSTVKNIHTTYEDALEVGISKALQYIEKEA